MPDFIGPRVRRLKTFGTREKRRSRVCEFAIPFFAFAGAISKRFAVAENRVAEFFLDLERRSKAIFLCHLGSIGRLSSIG